MSKQAKHIYEFGPFRLDSAERLLLRGGSSVSLTPKVFDTLLVLIENSGHLVEKDELMTRLWPDTFVEEGTLARNVSDLRKALGEAANGQKYIDTVPKRGYRFVAGVSEVCEESVELIVEKATRSRLVIEEEETITNDEVEAERALRITANGSASHAEYLIGEIRLHKLGAFISLAVLLGGVGALAYGIYRFAAAHKTVAHFQKVKLARLTTIGNATSPSVSPDGKFIAYVQVENRKYSLWTKAIAGGPPVQIVQPTEGRIYNTTFSPDGNHLYYIYEEKKGQNVLYQIAVLGGMQKRLLTKLDSHITFSPDGKQLAFVRYSNDSGESQLIVSNPEGSDERILATRASEERFSAGGPSWSPDGKIIAIGACLAGSTRRCLVVGVAVESREIKQLSPQRWDVLGRVEWFRDGTGLVLRADRQEGGQGQIWRLSYPSGEAQSITDDLNDYGFFSLTADSTAIVTVMRQRSSNIWVAPNADASKARQLTFSNKGDEGSLGVAWTPEGNIVYSSNGGSEHSNLWIMNGDGSNPKQLTDSPARADDSTPAVSPDGRYIVFCSNRSGKHNLWRLDIDGGNPKQLTNDVWMSADFSPDGRWFACTSGDYGKQTLWRVPVDGGSPVQLTDTSANLPAVSSDGKLIAYAYKNGVLEKVTKVVIISSEGGAPLKALEFNSAQVGGLQWSPDDSSIIYVDARQSGANLWRLPLDGGPAQQVTDFKSERIWNFYFTRDGRQLVCARGTTTSDVVMISDSK
jgi:Tol biopolymer transport system component/DNA-binding winged helix-turn-helix (wHTH) protein